MNGTWKWLAGGLLLALFGAIIGIYVQMGNLRVEMIYRVSSDVGDLRQQMSEEHTQIRERLAALEARLDYGGPSQSGNGGQ